MAQKAIAINCNLFSLHHFTVTDATYGDVDVDDLDTPVRLSEAGRRWLPPARTGNPVHSSVLFRWGEDGLIGPNGKRVFLSTFKVGGQRYTTQRAIQDFLGALNDCSPPAKKDAADDTTRRARDASKALENLGC